MEVEPNSKIAGKYNLLQRENEEICTRREEEKIKKSGRTSFHILHHLHH
jgi:hypothetical protein